MGAAVCAASRVGKGPIEIAAIRTAAPATTRNRDAVTAGRAFDWLAGVSLRGLRGRTQEWSSESGRKLGHCNIIALRYLPRAPQHRGADRWSRWKNDSMVRSVVGADTSRAWARGRNVRISTSRRSMHWPTPMLVANIEADRGVSSHVSPFFAFSKSAFRPAVRRSPGWAVLGILSRLGSQGNRIIQMAGVRYAAGVRNWPCVTSNAGPHGDA